MRKGEKALLMLGSSLLTAILMIAWPVREPLAVETEIIQHGELIQTVLMNGIVCHGDQQPCISLRSGRIKRVLVEQGQEISKGELLFQLDTAAEEQALSALYQHRFAQRAALNQLDSAASALLLQSELEWQSLESQLLAGIEAAQIRAPADGLMEAVYVQESEYVSEAALLGTAHGTGLQIAASFGTAEGNAIPFGAAGMATSGRKSAPVYLAQKTSADESGMQTFLFEIVGETKPDEWRVGDMVRVEVTKSMPLSGSLIPLSAVSADGTVWTIQNGQAKAQSISLGECSRTHAVADAAWANETVILDPDAYGLTDGMAVQEKK